MSSFLENKYRTMMASAGIEVNGKNPGDLLVTDDRIYRRIALQGSLGFGESYMDGWCECEKLDIFFTKFCSWLLQNQRKNLGSIVSLMLAGMNLVSNLQSRSRAFIVGNKHYNLGNDLFSLMLDEKMIYSCGYWKEAEDLGSAQIAKLDLVFKKLKLEPGMKVLDIGCGWGGAAGYAAEKYGVEVTGITISKEQAELARKHTRDLPVTILLQDYRELDGHFDRAYSIGMFEHVGRKNYRSYMQKVRALLVDDGLFLLHTIGGNFKTSAPEPWVERYIFPNGKIPAASEINASIEHLFIMEDWQNFGPDYDRTLMAWYQNFTEHLEDIKKIYGERFCRMWRYYLLSCAGTFRSRRTQLWQLVLSPLGGYRQRYDAPR